MSLSRAVSDSSDVQIISAYGPKIVVESVNDEPSMTKQSFKDECDVNLIMRRFLETGILEGDERSPRFLDCVGLQEIDYQKALNFVIHANECFGDLPASVRDRFQNNPAVMLDFLEKVENRDEAIRLGLIDNPAKPDATVPLGTPAVE